MLRAEYRRRGQADPPRQCCFGCRHVRLHLVQLRQQAVAFAVKALPRIGERHAPRGAVDELDAERVSAELPSLDADYYLCGPVAFMAAMQDVLEALGVAGERIHSETFGPATPAVGA